MAIALDLDFLSSETLDARITASGGANGTRVTSAGLIAAATTPRYDYDPATLAPKGLLIEEARTNALTKAQEFEHTDWYGSNFSVVANVATSPTGAANADRLVPSVTAGLHVLSHNSGGTAAVVKTFSIYAKAEGYSTIGIGYINNGPFNGITVNLLTGAIIAPASTTNNPFGGGQGLRSRVADAGNGWWRIEVSQAVGVTGNAPVGIYVIPDGANYQSAGDGAKGVLLFGAQDEVGSFATSYIPTTTAAVTRTADDMKMTSTNFSSWFGASPTQGTFIVDYDLLDTSSASRYIVAAVEDLNNYHRVLTYSGGIQGVTSTTATSNTGVIVAAPSLNATHRTAYAFALNDLALCTDGGTVSTDATSPTGVAATTLYLGAENVSGSIGTMCGHIRRLKFDSTRRSNADLQGLTVARSGAAAITEGGDTVTAIGQVKIKGTAAITEGEDSAGGTGETGVQLVTPAGRIATPSL